MRVSLDHSPTRTSTPRRGRSPIPTQDDDRDDNRMDDDTVGGEDEESQTKVKASPANTGGRIAVDCLISQAGRHLFYSVAARSKWCNT